MQFSCIAVDDDIHSLEILTEYISQFPQLKLTKKFTSSLKALEYIRTQNQLDILFLDIEMPEMKGTELYNLVKHKVNKIIFTTGHHQNALDIYYNKLDELLFKPYPFAKFEQMIKRLFPLPSDMLSTDFFFLKSKGDKSSIVKVKYADIVAIESMQNYISIYTTNRKIVSHLTMTAVKEILKGQLNIIQIHRSFLISIDHIEEMEANLIKLTGNIKVCYGEKYKTHLIDYIKSKTVN